VRSVAIQDSEANLRLRASISGLADRAPMISARTLLSEGQLRFFMGLGVAAVIGLLISPIKTVIAFTAVVTVLYLLAVTYRFVLFLRSARSDVVVRISDEEARAFPDAELPVYTVLIPAFREPQVINLLIRNIARLEYPADKLDVKILVEADDDETIRAIGRADPGRQFELVFIPPSDPRTKPKALNYGLGLAKGELVAVYDAEDIPDPLQLRRAAIGLRRLGPEVACLQGKLTYHNPTQNIITRWFTLEYAMWFSYFLPGLAASSAPIPLGGTSNHFRADALRRLGGWDPFNVTEDADLGVRMYREGYTVGVLDSITYEEANSDFVNWVRQRSRWYKGYLQTFIVHMRSPRRMVHDLGWKSTGHFCVFVGGTPILAILNPLFWLMTLLWFVGQPAIIRELFPAPVYYMGLISWAFGNFTLVYLTILSCRLIKRPELIFAAVLVPLYWVMMSMAAVKAIWQLFRQPTHWEKTVHGLHEEARATAA